MSETAVVVEPTERQKVYRWRFAELRRVGYSAVYADILAAREDVDLHAALEIVEAGCRHELAVLILA